MRVHINRLLAAGVCGYGCVHELGDRCVAVRTAVHLVVAWQLLPEAHVTEHALSGVLRLLCDTNSMMVHFAHALLGCRRVVSRKLHCWPGVASRQHICPVLLLP